MTLVAVVETLILVVLFVPVSLAVLLLMRRFTISRRAGTSISAFRTHPDTRATRKWRPGILALSARSLEWYPMIGLTATPSHQWSRPTVELHDVNTDSGNAPWLLAAQPDLRVVSCEAHPRADGPRSFQVMLPLDSYMALRSWAESSPPLDQRHEF